MKKIIVPLLLAFVVGAAFAKLPALSDEAKAKAAEAAAKTAWSGKVDAYLLCKSQDKSAAHFYKTAKAEGKDAKPAPAMPACVDAGPFVYPPAPVAAAAAPVPAAAPATPAKKS
jgi:hypothetical protein